jgi:DnaJ-class molecular chaperone
MEEVQIEKCAACNGKGKRQIFSSELNKWMPSSLNCEICKGTGELQYILIENGIGFMKTKVYFESK